MKIRTVMTTGKQIQDDIINLSSLMALKLVHKWEKQVLLGGGWPWTPPRFGLSPKCLQCVAPPLLESSDNMSMSGFNRRLHH